MAIWGSVQEAMAGALDAAREAHGAVAVRAVGITNQRETTVVWDRCTGRPLHNAIVWLDGRTADVCDAMAQRLPGGRDHFRPVTGLPISTYFSAYKLKWLLENVSAVAAAAAEGRLMFGTVDSWLLYKLTGPPAGLGLSLSRGSIRRAVQQGGGLCRRTMHPPAAPVTPGVAWNTPSQVCPKQSKSESSALSSPPAPQATTCM